MGWKYAGMDLDRGQQHWQSIIILPLTSILDQPPPHLATKSLSLSTLWESCGYLEESWRVLVKHDNSGFKCCMKEGDGVWNGSLVLFFLRDSFWLYCNPKHHFFLCPSYCLISSYLNFWGRLRAESSEVHLNNRQNEEIKAGGRNGSGGRPVCIHVTQLYQIIPQ